MRLGLVGYGAGGRYFHAPFIAAAEGVELAGVVTRSPQRRAELAADYPGVPAYDSLADLLAAGVDAVTITTPPQTRRELVLEGVAAGVHVIADKPFAPTADAGRELVAAAAEASVVLNVFHNRRWDADIRTLAAVLAGGDARRALAGRVPVRPRRRRDPGGRPQAGCSATSAATSSTRRSGCWARPGASTPSSNGSTCPRAAPTAASPCPSPTPAASTPASSSTKINHLEDRELRAYGSAGGYVAQGTDVQAQAIFAGLRPVDLGPKLGLRRPGALGHAAHRRRSVRVPSEQGAYQDYYTQFAAALRGDGEFPVPAEEAVHTLEVLDAARISAHEQQVVSM